MTGKLQTKYSVAESRFNKFADAIKNSKDADEQFKLTKSLLNEEQKMGELWKEALQAYVNNIGTDTHRIYDDVDYMIKQVTYEHIVSAYSLRVTINSNLKSKERIEKMRKNGSIPFVATIDDIQAENIKNIIFEIQYACFIRIVDEQLHAIQCNYEKEKSEELQENIARICREYIAELIEAAGGIEVFIRDIQAKVVDVKKNIKDTSNTVDADAIPIETTSRELIIIPTSRELHLMSSVMSNRHNLPAYIDKKNTANKNKLLSTQTKGVDPIEYKTGDNEYKRILVKGKESITIALPDMQKPIKNNRPASNMFTFLLPQIEKQAFNNKGELYAEHISFNLQELVDIGMYSDIRSARRGNETAAEALKGIEVQAKNDAGAFVLASVFPTIDKTENNICTYHINPLINWTNLLKYHYQLPKYYFSLPTKAQDLLNNLVAYLARQNAAQVKDKGFFTISLRQVQAELNLPDEHKTKDVNGKIKKPIAEAIRDINDADGGNYYKLELHVNKNAKPSQYLDTGYIRVYPLNEVKEHIISVLDKRNKIIEDNAKKIESRKVKALAKAYKEGKTDEDTLGGNE